MLDLEELEKSFFTHGFVLKKEEIKEIYDFLLEKSFKKDNTEKDSFNFKQFDSLML